MYMKSLAYDGASYISKLLPKYLGAEDTKLNAWIMEHMLVGVQHREDALRRGKPGLEGPHPAPLSYRSLRWSHTIL